MISRTQCAGHEYARPAPVFPCPPGSRRAAVACWRRGEPRTSRPADRSRRGERAFRLLLPRHAACRLDRLERGGRRGVHRRVRGDGMLDQAWFAAGGVRHAADDLLPRGARRFTGQRVGNVHRAQRAFHHAGHLGTMAVPRDRAVAGGCDVSRAAGRGGGLRGRSARVTAVSGLAEVRGAARRTSAPRSPRPR